MASEVDAAQDFVIFASCENRHAAEHMLASLGRGFRKNHRKGHATALVIHRNKDGSLTLTQSRVPSAGGFVYTVTRTSPSSTKNSVAAAKVVNHDADVVHPLDSHVFDGQDIDPSVEASSIRTTPSPPTEWRRPRTDASPVIWILLYSPLPWVSLRRNVRPLRRTRQCSDGRLAMKSSDIA
jgi:hypothetical protein